MQQWCKNSKLFTFLPSLSLSLSFSLSPPVCLSPIVSRTDDNRDRTREIWRGNAARKANSKREKRAKERKIIWRRVTNENVGVSCPPLSLCVFYRSTNLNACGESVSTLTRCSPLNPQLPPPPPQPLHQPPLPTQVTTPATATSEPVHEQAPPNRDRDHHALHLDNRDYESVFIIERRNSKPNLR